MRRYLPRAIALLPLLAGIGVAGADDRLTVYRCTDASGRVTIGDRPCPQGQVQQTRDMARPAPPQPRPEAGEPAPAPSAPTPAPPATVIVQRAPQPMYECVMPDGERYLSDSGEGRPRWEPTWHWGRPGRWNRARPSAGDNALGEYHANRPLGGWAGAPAPQPGGASPPPPPGRPSPHPGYGYGGGMVLVRDSCHALPQGDVCRRLGNRRDDIRRRIFQAQETERLQLREEERTINARLAEDCAG